MKLRKEFNGVNWTVRASRINFDKTEVIWNALTACPVVITGVLMRKNNTDI